MFWRMIIVYVCTTTGTSDRKDHYHSANQKSPERPTLKKNPIFPDSLYWKNKPLKASP